MKSNITGDKLKGFCKKPVFEGAEVIYSGTFSTIVNIHKKHKVKVRG